MCVSVHPPAHESEYSVPFLCAADPGNLPSKKTAVKKERGEREEQVDQEMEALIKNMDIEDL